MRFVWAALVVVVAVLASNVLKHWFGEGVRAAVLVVLIALLLAGFAIQRVVRGRIRGGLKDTQRERWLTAQQLAEYPDDEIASTINEMELSDEEERRLRRAIERVRRSKATSK